MKDIKIPIAGALIPKIGTKVMLKDRQTTALMVTINDFKLFNFKYSNTNPTT